MEDQTGYVFKSSLECKNNNRQSFFYFKVHLMTLIPFHFKQPKPLKPLKWKSRYLESKLRKELILIMTRHVYNGAKAILFSEN